MGVSQDLSMLALVTSASLAVKFVMAVLLIASLMSWWFIFQKLFQVARATKKVQAFEQAFWNGADLNQLYQGIARDPSHTSEMERIFEAGFREFMKLKNQPGTDASAMTESARRAMRASYQREMDGLESHLSFLATVGSVSVYVGLFGTVWGIMNAFRSLANVAQTTLANIAPGIAETLVATAMGLFAAIPAVIAYNHFTHDIDRLANRYESFIEEFSNILQRQAHKK
ncbi:MAG TPA: protein TolQ [Burkholderiales bacterium]|nr:protein TolQ [Burkholderiales bacterium]